MLAAQPGFQRREPGVHVRGRRRSAGARSRDGRQTVVLAAFSTQERSAAAVARWRPAAGGAGRALRWPRRGVQRDQQLHLSCLGPVDMPGSRHSRSCCCSRCWVFRGLDRRRAAAARGCGSAIVLYVPLPTPGSTRRSRACRSSLVNLVTGMGLGLGIDYSLFVLSRYREELARRSRHVRGHQTHDADRRSHRAVQLADSRLGARFAARVSAAVRGVDGQSAAWSLPCSAGFCLAWLCCRPCSSRSGRG